jgi:hypothetical protein
MAIVVGTYSDYKGIYLFPVLKIYNTDWYEKFYFYFKNNLVLVVVAIALDFGYTTIYKQKKEENRLCFLILLPENMMWLF